MKKFNTDIFFDILSGKDKENLVKKMNILQNPQVLFQYALAKGYGFNKKGLWYDFINDLFDMDQYSIKSKLNELDNQIKYKSILAIKGGDEKHVFFLDVGLGWFRLVWVGLGWFRLVLVPFIFFTTLQGNLRSLCFFNKYGNLNSFRHLGHWFDGIIATILM